MSGEPHHDGESLRAAAEELRRLYDWGADLLAAPGAARALVGDRLGAGPGRPTCAYCRSCLWWSEV